MPEAHHFDVTVHQGFLPCVSFYLRRPTLLKFSWAFDSRDFLTFWLSKSEAEEQTTHFSNSLPSLNPIAGGGFLGVCINQCHPNTPGSLFTEDALALAMWTVMNGVDTGRKRGEELWSITESREQKEISKPWAIQATSGKDFSTQGFISHGPQGHTILWRLNVHSFLFLP